MKRPMITLPALMMVCLVLIIMTLFTIQYTQMETDYSPYSSIDESKVNLPGPNSQEDEENEEEIEQTIDLNGGKIVYLKEDFQEEEEETPPVELTNYNENSLTEDEAFMQEMTKSESLNSQDDTDNYLVIAGTYTDDMVILSKQAQYMHKGYSAEIIQFEDAESKNICMGRYDDEKTAESLANEIETLHDISTYVYHQAARIQ